MSEVEAILAAGGPNSVTRQARLAEALHREMGLQLNNPVQGQEGGEAWLEAGRLLASPNRLASLQSRAASVGQSVLASSAGLLNEVDPTKLLVGGGLLVGASALAVGGIALARSRSSSGGASRSRKGKAAGRAAKKARDVRGTQRQYQAPGGGDVKFTKHGQPYVIGRDGKARFIKKPR